MTWAKGTTTWGELPQKLARLMCGEVADDFSTTVASTDRWVREFTRTVTDGVLNSTTTVTSATAAFTAADKGANVIGTGIPAGTTISTVNSATSVTLSAAATASASGVTLQICHDTIRTKSALDVATGACSNRTGYFSMAYANDNTGATTKNTVLRVTNPYTSDPSTSGFHRWMVGISVTAANTVPGNYSTALVQELTFDADSGAAIANNINRNPSAAGVITLTNGCQVTISDPSGTLTVGVIFQRAFSSTYMYGIDHWPMLYRLGTGSPTFSVAPPGVAGTDYAIVSDAYPQIANGSFVQRSNLFHGLGVKTATGLGSGNLYTVDVPMALAKGRIFASSGGVLSLDVGQAKVDTVNTAVPLIRNVCGYRVTTWCRCATTAGSVTASAQVQYFASITADGIALVLNMDPAATGKLGASWWGKITPADSTYDVFPVTFNVGALDYTADQPGNDFIVGVQYDYWSQRRHQDGLAESGRDWQTKWMRYDFMGTPSAVAGRTGQYVSDITSALSGSGSIAAACALAPMGAITNVAAGSGVTTNAYPAREVKPSLDGNWWLYGATYVEGRMDSQAATIDESRHVRGTQNTRYFFIPSDGWVSGDELTDTGTGTKYLLVVPDYAGVGSRLRLSANNFFGGLAVAEL